MACGNLIVDVRVSARFFFYGNQTGVAGHNILIKNNARGVAGCPRRKGRTQRSAGVGEDLPLQGEKLWKKL